MRSALRIYVGVVRRAAELVGHTIAIDEPLAADVRRRQMLDADGVNVVIDVGANVGQFGQALRAAGWSGRIVSFEPQSEPAVALRKAADRDGNWETHRLALGAEPGVVSLKIASIHPRSSVLPISALHHELLPDTSYIKTEEVPCERLDDALQERVAPGDVLALKLDVQGYELHVLRGALRTLERAQLIELEMSLIDLYDGQPTAAELVRFLDDQGFELVSAEAESTDRDTGRTNWLNAMFRRSAYRTHRFSRDQPTSLYSSSTELAGSPTACGGSESSIGIGHAPAFAQDH